ncbi:MAG: hypothetical protein M3P00_03530 [Gemmatimonadota bacterium]|nr:hypothetical protein [Gemmatimonadota bacterium]
MLENAFGRRIGSIKRKSWGHGIDFAIKDASGTEIGRIVDLAHIDAQSAADETAGTYPG